MGFVEAIQTCFSKYVTFSGRADRSEYWWFFLFNFLVSLVAELLDYAIGASVISTIASLALLLPGIAVAVRRCHDTNHSGWWILCPIYNIILMFLPTEPEVNAAE
jgi:uncharacterized membrane protein YhaH (DUF805 family)